MKLFASLACVLFAVAAAFAQRASAPAPAVGQSKDGWGLFTPPSITWVDGPASLRQGTKMVIMEGDPAADGVFTMRLWMPDGFIVSPHSHTQIEHVTIMAGILNFGMGETFDKAATRPMPAGSFGYWPIGMKHYAWTTGETVLQLHGRGPWTVTYVNPADDPRHR